MVVKQVEIPIRWTCKSSNFIIHPQRFQFHRSTAEAGKPTDQIWSTTGFYKWSFIATQPRSFMYYLWLLSGSNSRNEQLWQRQSIPQSLKNLLSGSFTEKSLQTPAVEEGIYIFKSTPDYADLTHFIKHCYRDSSRSL